MKALSENELKNVSGGTLNDDAKDWVSKHEGTVRARAAQKGIPSGQVDWALSYVKGPGSGVYDVPALKNAIASFGVDVSDLN